MKRVAWFRAAILITLLGTLVTGGFLACEYRDYMHANKRLFENEQGIIQDKALFDRQGYYVIPPETRNDFIREAKTNMEYHNDMAAIFQVALLILLLLPFSLFFAVSWILTGSFRQRPSPNDSSVQ